MYAGWSKVTAAPSHNSAAQISVNVVYIIIEISKKNSDKNIVISGWLRLKDLQGGFFPPNHLPAIMYIPNIFSELVVFVLFLFPYNHIKCAFHYNLIVKKKTKENGGRLPQHIKICVLTKQEKVNAISKNNTTQTKRWHNTVFNALISDLWVFCPGASLLCFHCNYPASSRQSVESSQASVQTASPLISPSLINPCHTKGAPLATKPNELAPWTNV